MTPTIIILLLVSPWVAVFVLHYLLLVIVAIFGGTTIDKYTGDEIPDVYTACARLRLSSLKSILFELEDLALKPHVKLWGIFRFFYQGFIVKKWLNTWIGEKIYVYFARRKGLKMLKDMEKQKRETP